MNQLKMKNYIKVLAIVLAFPIVFSSCKEDEDQGASLVGTWRETTYVSSGCLDPTDNENFTCTTSCEELVVTATTVKIGSDPAINYTVNGNQLTVTETLGSATISITVTFAVTATTLVITQVDAASDGGCTNVTTYTRIN